MSYYQRLKKWLLVWLLGQKDKGGQRCYQNPKYPNLKIKEKGEKIASRLSAGQLSYCQKWDNTYSKNFEVDPNINILDKFENTLQGQKLFDNISVSADYIKDM
ncbi:hypothetical protein C2G38_2221856 [Gigaspora rosea]|uniref:Uncharacterized protein n=1 Tax=Gigaspora rosea TaxID=44941 RepID=A0A397U7B0_9GLOM|nr:hypothetical protein C2G38_2221856 [Gigaspora rosea]